MRRKARATIASRARHPVLSFELAEALRGAHSVTILYREHRGLSAEVFWFDDNARVVRAAAH